MAVLTTHLYGNHKRCIEKHCNKLCMVRHIVNTERPPFGVWQQSPTLTDPNAALLSSIITYNLDSAQCLQYNKLFRAIRQEDDLISNGVLLL